MNRIDPTKYKLVLKLRKVGIRTLIMQVVHQSPGVTRRISGPSVDLYSDHNIKITSTNGPELSPVGVVYVRGVDRSRDNDVCERLFESTTSRDVMYDFIVRAVAHINAVPGEYRSRTISRGMFSDAFHPDWLRI